MQRIFFLVFGLVFSPGSSQSVFSTFTVVNSGFSAYRFNGGSVDNPTLYLQKGENYSFTVNSPGHPFRIIGNTGATYPQGSYNTLPDCDSCVVGQDADRGTVTISVPLNPLTTTAGYICTYHSSSELVVSATILSSSF